MLSTVLVYLCTGLQCFLKVWHAFDSVDIHLYSVGMLSTGWECLLQGCNALDRVGIPLYRVGMLARGLECFRQSWNSFVHASNAF
jgi:hypothetical protein